MKILWALMDYNEPFSGGVERTFHNLIRCAGSEHTHHIWPITLSGRRTLPPNTTKVTGPDGTYDLAVVESNNIPMQHLGRIRKISGKVIMKMQHIRRGVVSSVCKAHGPMAYFGYDYPDEAALSVHPENLFYRVPPFKDTKYWVPTGRSKIKGRLAIVGRVGRAKLITQFVKAYNNHPLKDTTSLEIVGGSNCHPEIVELRNTLNLVNINYVWGQTFKPDDEVRRAYMEAEILLVTSDHETFGHQIIESMLCGTPVMTSFNRWCTSLQWFGKYIGQCIDHTDLLDRIVKKGYKNPLPYRKELCNTFGISENRERLNAILTEVVNE